MNILRWLIGAGVRVYNFLRSPSGKKVLTAAEGVLSIVQNANARKTTISEAKVFVRREFEELIADDGVVMQMFKRRLAEKAVAVSMPEMSTSERNAAIEIAVNAAKQ